MTKAGKGNAHTYPIGWNISLPAQLLTVLTAYHFYSDILACSPFCYKVRRKNKVVLQKEYFRTRVELKDNEFISLFVETCICTKIYRLSA